MPSSSSFIILLTSFLLDSPRHSFCVSFQLHPGCGTGRGCTEPGHPASAQRESEPRTCVQRMRGLYVQGQQSTLSGVSLHAQVIISLQFDLTLVFFEYLFRYFDLQIEFAGLDSACGVRPPSLSPGVQCYHVPFTCARSAVHLDPARHSQSLLGQPVAL